MTPRRSTNSGPVLATTVFFLAASCGLTDNQRTSVRNFARSAQAVSEITESELPKMRNQLVEINRSIVQLIGAQRAQLGENDTIGGVHVLNLDGALDPERVRGAQDAVRGLAAYAGALLAVVDYDSKKDLKEAADKLSDSLKGVKVGGRQLLDDANADAVANVVRYLGGIFVEHERAKAVRHIVATYRPLVPTLVTLLKQDFNPTSGSGGFALEVSTRSKDLSVEAMSAMRNPASDAQAIAAPAAYELALTSLRQQELLWTRAADVFDKLAKANEVMAKHMEDDEVGVDEIKVFYKSVKDLIDNIKVLAEK